MACASTGNCSSCSGANCSGGCQGGCNGCSGCGGSCSPGCGTACGGNCTGTCLSCTGGCGGGCKGCTSCTDTCSGCGSGCASSCTGQCKGCSGTCKDTCTGGCGSGCDGGCKGDCSTACNATCVGATQSANLEKLILTKKFEANNISDIINFIEFEALNRRGIEITDLSVSVMDILDDEIINSIIDNLAILEYPINQVKVEQAAIASKPIIKEIIAKAKEANAEAIYL